MSLLLKASRAAKLYKSVQTPIAFLRYLSSKKSDNNVASELATTAKLPISDSKGKTDVDLKNISNQKSSKKSSTKNVKGHSSKYLSFDELPKAPQSVIDQFSGKLFTHTPRNIFEADEDELKPEPFSYDFSMLPHDIIREPLNKAHASEIWHRINGVPSFSQNSEHPMKKSITGMFDLNPKLNEVSDELLWKLCPQGNMYENAPFDGESGFDSVKIYEAKINKDLFDQFETTQAHAKEIKEFEKDLYSSKSLVRTKTTKAAKDSTEKSGGRKKLDRALLRKYIKYSEDGEKTKNK